MCVLKHRKSRKTQLAHYDGQLLLGYDQHMETLIQFIVKTKGQDVSFCKFSGQIVNKKKEHTNSLILIHRTDFKNQNYIILLMPRGNTFLISNT